MSFTLCKNCMRDLPITMRQVGGVHMYCEQEYFKNKTVGMIKVRPQGGGAWCVVEPNDLTSVIQNSDETYEVQSVKMSKAELEHMPEFKGW